MFKPNFDKVVSTVVGLGVPGLYFLILLGGAGGAAAGAAGLTAALAAFGPGGMIGGLISIPVGVLIFKGVSEYGLEKILVSVLKEMQKKGETKESLFEKIDKYPVSKNLKASLKEEINKSFDFESEKEIDIEAEESNEVNVKENVEEDEALEVVSKEVESILNDILMNIIIKNSPNKLVNSTESQTFVIKEYNNIALKRLKEEKEISEALKDIYVNPEDNEEYDKPLSYYDILKIKYNNWIINQFESDLTSNMEEEEIKEFFKPLFYDFLKKANFDKYYEVLIHTAAKI